MCMLCTAVPTVLTAGLAAESKQRRVCKAAQEKGEPRPPTRPYLALALVSAFGLIATSVVYHTQLNGA